MAIIHTAVPAVLLLAAVACAPESPAPAADSRPPAIAASAPSAQPAVVRGASDADVLRDLLAVEAAARKIAADIYQPEVSGVRSLIGGEKVSQKDKAAETFNEVYEKELRRAAHRHGLTYDEAVARLKTARPGR